MAKVIRHISARAAIYAVAALFTSVLAHAQNVYRCEGDDGKVTYSDAPCPTSARKARRLDDQPPVIVHESKDATEAGSDAKRDRRHDDGRSENKNDGAAEARAIGEPRLLGRLEPSRPDPRAKVNPILEDQKITAEREQQARECESLARRLRFLRDDVEAAQSSRRSSAELALRRAQDEFQQSCPQQ
jgi:hypothetical protein